MLTYFQVRFLTLIFSQVQRIMQLCLDFCWFGDIVTIKTMHVLNTLAMYKSKPPAVMHKPHKLFVPTSPNLIGNVPDMSQTHPRHDLRTDTFPEIPGTEMDGWPCFVHFFIHMSTLSSTWNKRTCESTKHSKFTIRSLVEFLCG